MYRSLIYLVSLSVVLPQLPRLAAFRMALWLISPRNCARLSFIACIWKLDISSKHRFLVGAHNNADCKQWAAEGLAYLTLDADVKVCAYQMGVFMG